VANRERGEQRLVVAGVAYVLRLTVAAACELQDRSGRTFDAITAGVAIGRMVDLRWLLWAALQDRHASEFQTAETAGALIDRAGGVFAIRLPLAEFVELNRNPDLIPARKGTPPEPAADTWRRLYIQIRANGIGAEAFWQLSLREAWMELAVVKEQHRQRVELAYNIEYMARQKVLDRKAFDTLAGPTHRRPQSLEEQRAVMYQLSGNLGIPLIRVPYARAAAPSEAA